VELVVPTAFVLDGSDFGGCLIDICPGDWHAPALLLEVDLLGISPLDAICIGLDLVFKQSLSHIVKRTDLDMGGGVVLVHDGLELPHREEKFFSWATPPDGAAVL